MSDQPLQPQPESPVKKSAPKGRLSVVAKSEAASVRAVEFVDQLDVQTQRQRQVGSLPLEFPDPFPVQPHPQSQRLHPQPHLRPQRLHPQPHQLELLQHITCSSISNIAESLRRNILCSRPTKCDRVFCPRDRPGLPGGWDCSESLERSKGEKEMEKSRKGMAF